MRFVLGREEISRRIFSGCAFSKYVVSGPLRRRRGRNAPSASRHSPAASVKAAMVESAMVMEMVEAMSRENRTADEERWPIEPGIPVVLLGVGIRADRLWRQRVDLPRQAGCIQRDLPRAIQPLTRFPGGLLRLSCNHHLHGELTAIPKVIPGRRQDHLCLRRCHVRRGRGSLSLTSRQSRHRCNTQKGRRILFSRDL